MKVIKLADLKNTDRQVDCPNKGFTSFRFLLERDNMGFTLTKTLIPKGIDQHWHYKNHLEACYCISGRGLLTNVVTDQQYMIEKDTMYALNLNDDHFFKAFEDTELICVFNPPLKGREVHKEDGSYE
jgi:L-ectoine synthase